MALDEFKIQVSIFDWSTPDDVLLLFVKANWCWNIEISSFYSDLFSRTRQAYFDKPLLEENMRNGSEHQVQPYMKKKKSHNKLIQYN